MYIIIYTYDMNKKPSSSHALRQQFLQQLQRLWPVIKGSLAEVRKPCVRPNCRACARGHKHPAFILAFTQKGRRRCMYAPSEMVAPLRRALQNGRQLEQLLYQIGPALLHQHRRQRHPLP
mgnify:CR=1 FL=1